MPRKPNLENFNLIDWLHDAETRSNLLAALANPVLTRSSLAHQLFKRRCYRRRNEDWCSRPTFNKSTIFESKTALFITQNYLFTSLVKRWITLSFAYLISLGKLAGLYLGSASTHVNLTEQEQLYEKIIGAGVFRPGGSKWSSAGKRASRTAIILANCLRTHSRRLENQHNTYWADKSYMCWASGVCAINPGAQNFHSPAFIVSEQHLTDVSARPRLVCMQPRAPWLLSKLELYQMGSVQVASMYFLSEHARCSLDNNSLRRGAVVLS